MNDRSEKFTFLRKHELVQLGVNPLAVIDHFSQLFKCFAVEIRLHKDLRRNVLEQFGTTQVQAEEEQNKHREHLEELERKK